MSDTKKWDALAFIMAVEEEGPMSYGEYVDGMQKLIDSGMVWSLQGTWQRAAQALIAAGTCTQPQQEPVPSPKRLRTGRKLLSRTQTRRVLADVFGCRENLVDDVVRVRVDDLIGKRG